MSDYSAPMLQCHKQVSTNVKDNDKSNVLFMWRKKRMRGSNASVFLLVVFTFCFYK